MFLGINVLKTCPPKKSRRSCATWLLKLVRSSYMVSRIPSTASAGLRFRLIRINVSKSSETPSKAKYSHWIGMRIDCAATKAFTVNKSRDGGQSKRMKEYDSGS